MWDLRMNSAPRTRVCTARSKKRSRRLIRMIARCSRQNISRARMCVPWLNDLAFPTRRRSPVLPEPGRSCGVDCCHCFPVMNDSHRDEARLIADIFHDDWDEGAPAQFARAAAAHARQHKRKRRALVAGGASVAVLAVAAVAFFPRPHPTAPVTHSPREPKITRGYEIASDAELFAALSDRTVVMVKRRDGTNEFVLIGE